MTNNKRERIRRSTLRVSFLNAVLASLAFSAIVQFGEAQEPPDKSPDAIPDNAQVARKPLIVATKEAIPFAFRDEHGEWQGLSIELWREIAAQLKLEEGTGYQLVEMKLPDILSGLEDGSIDVAAAAMTMTASRETVMDFTHGFHNSGLGIAVSSQNQRRWSAALKRVFSLAFIEVVGGMFLLLLGAGVLVYYFERRGNPEQFGGSLSRGIAAGIWWAAVTMTTVGYGDKAPRTAGGRTVAVVWMFAALLLIAGFTASVTSALTVTELESSISGPEDFRRIRVATVTGSTSEEYLKTRFIPRRSFETVREALQVLKDREVDAVVYDAPILKFIAFNEFGGSVQVLPRIFERQDYAFGLPSGSPHREEFNRAMLKVINQPEWDNKVRLYLGQ